MKKSLLFLLLFFCASFTFAGTLILQGKYQNQNLYVLNGSMENGVGFCTYEVSINDRVCTDEVNSSAFEIDFKQFNIKVGTPVIVKIKHKDDCSPKVVNPEVLQPKATYEVLDINIDKNEILNWTTKNEMGSLPYVIEQFRWHKWVQVGEVKGIGNSTKNEYSFKVTPHSGENKFRIKQVGYGGVSKKFNSITYFSNVAEPRYTIDKELQVINFTNETLYEMYDIYGNIVKRGYGNSCTISNLNKGTYYLCYDNLVTEVTKKSKSFTGR